jgi:hypothetical protein
VPRELNVRENNIDAMRLDEREGAFRRPGFKYLPTGIAKFLGDHIAHDPLVFHDENYP